MIPPPDFAKVLDAAERLELADQAKLLAILHRRQQEALREELETVVAAGRRDFSAGQYRSVPLGLLIKGMVFGVEFLATTLEPNPLDYCSTPLLRTHAFADHLRVYWERYGQTDFPSFKLQELLDQFLTEATRPKLPTERLRGRFGGCHVWSAHTNLVVLFDRVEHERQPAVLVLALSQPVRWS